MQDRPAPLPQSGAAADPPRQHLFSAANDGYLRGVNLLVRPDLRWQSGRTAASRIRDASSQGRTPLELLIVVGHGARGGNQLGTRQGTRLFSADNVFEIATESNNAQNTLSSAKRKIGPPKCWFTKQSNVYGVGCYTSQRWTNDWASRIVRSGGTVWGTPGLVEAFYQGNRSAVWLESDRNRRAETLDELLNLGWVATAGTQ